MTRLLSRVPRPGIAVAVLAIAYSAAHIVTTGVVAPWSNFYGDFLSAWPGYYVAAWNPALYAGSLSGAWWKAPIWSYGPVLHLVYLPFTLLPDLGLAYKAILVECYGYILLAFLPLSIRALTSPGL